MLEAGAVSAAIESTSNRASRKRSSLEMNKDPASPSSAAQQPAKRQNFSAMATAAALTSANGVKAGNHPNKATTAKKLVIKNLKIKPTLPENFQERSVDKLKRAVVAIQTSEAIDVSLEELYQAVENLCSHGMAERVYANLR